MTVAVLSYLAMRPFSAIWAELDAPARAEFWAFLSQMVAK